MTPRGNQAREAFSFSMVVLHSLWSAVIALPPEVWAVGFYSMFKLPLLEALAFVVFEAHIFTSGVFSTAEVTASDYIK